VAVLPRPATGDIRAAYRAVASPPDRSVIVRLALRRHAAISGAPAAHPERRRDDGRRARASVGSCRPRQTFDPRRPGSSRFQSHQAAEGLTSMACPQRRRSPASSERVRRLRGITPSSRRQAHRVVASRPSGARDAGGHTRRVSIHRRPAPLAGPTEPFGSRTESKDPNGAEIQRANRASSRRSPSGSRSRRRSRP
jgi:hypothetical protein